eukprot:Mycagemm_TRINITY_DN8149_c0_g1::TRINITY_DN8149_c0_g1_i1::g.59::m.59 type:complete len:125 gc:universal TRINITY_DN8149_c0_g1_i1:474-100(-)
MSWRGPMRPNGCRCEPRCLGSSMVIALLTCGLALHPPMTDELVLCPTVYFPLLPLFICQRALLFALHIASPTTRVFCPLRSTAWPLGVGWRRSGGFLQDLLIAHHRIRTPGGEPDNARATPTSP